ncbi:MAG: hypothetical protein IT360_13765 [Gemmatimonadaceae bacterium]|nr:hypothetical protein [Gemmatimonadaceae bacterium]
MASQLDGAGQSKLATLDDAQAQLQRLHGIVEHYAMAVRNQQATAGFRQQLLRAGTPLVGLLKPQFGVIADVVSAFLLVASRGGGDQAKVRALREAVASIRAQVDISATKVKEKHTLTVPAPEAE